MLNGPNSTYKLYRAVSGIESGMVEGQDSARGAVLRNLASLSRYYEVDVSSLK